MHNRVPAVRCTKARNSSMRTSLSSAGVSWRILTGCPSYARNHGCALPSPSPFHYVMAKIVPAMKLAAHAKSGTLYVRSCGRTIVRPNLFGLMGYYYFVQLWGYAAYDASSAIRVNYPCLHFFLFLRQKRMS